MADPTSAGEEYDPEHPGTSDEEHTPDAGNAPLTAWSLDMLAEPMISMVGTPPEDMLEPDFDLELGSDGFEWPPPTPTEDRDGKGSECTSDWLT